MPKTDFRTIFVKYVKRRIIEHNSSIRLFIRPLPYSCDRRGKMVEQATALRVRCEKNNTSFARFTFFLYFYMLFNDNTKIKTVFL